MIKAQVARNGSSVAPPDGLRAANTARAGESIAAAAAPCDAVTVSPTATQATRAKSVIASD